MAYTKKRVSWAILRREARGNMAEDHQLMGGKLHVYRRENSGNWQCSTYLAGKNWRVSTKEDSLSHAKDFAEDWYLEPQRQKPRWSV